MRSTLPRFVERTRAKGKDYHYFRRHGERWRLPGAPGHPEFTARYLELLAQTNGDNPASRHAEHTVGALIADFRASDEFGGLRSRTQVNYIGMLDYLAPIAHFPAREIRRKHIRALRKQFSGKGRTQHFFVQVTSALFGYGMQEDAYDIDINPAAKFKRVGDVNSYKAWTEEQCATFEASAPPHHLMTAYMLGRYTGQRRGDILAMLRRAYDPAGKGSIEVKQSKTGAELAIPVHVRLKAYLDALPHDALLFIVDQHGRAYTDREDSFTKEFRKAMNAAGLRHLHFHGLRHTAGGALAEAGCSAHEIQSITGHRSLQMVERYTKAARQKRLASAAITKLEGTGTERESAKPPK